MTDAGPAVSRGPGRTVTGIGRAAEDWAASASSRRSWATPLGWPSPAPVAPTTCWPVESRRSRRRGAQPSRCVVRLGPRLPSRRYRWHCCAAGCCGPPNGGPAPR